MKKMKHWMLCMAAASLSAALFAAGCSEENDNGREPGGEEGGEKELAISMTGQIPWYETNPEGRRGDFSVSTEAHRLEFFGWSEEEDERFTVSFPESTEGYRRAILTYRMGGWNEGPSEWDHTTMVFVRNKADGEWYELARAFTPYGGGFGSDWEKIFYMDVTEYLPMLTGETEFRLYYGGFDATDRRAHTVTLGFDLYEGTPERRTIYTAKVYDSSRNETSYRAWAYGFAAAPIEAAERLGERTFDIPAGVKSLEMKVSISGHGHDQGTFPDRVNYITKNAAEFDENTYEIVLNGQVQPFTGRIFYDNSDNYWQTGTYLYDRANWAPGNPLNVHYWLIYNLPDKGGRLTLDLNLERFESIYTEANDGQARYIVEVDLFGFDEF